MNKFVLKDKASKVRKLIIKMAYSAQSAHTGGALSIVEILVALYFKIMKVNPQNPYDKNRDRLIFSKAHDAKALYAILAEKGYFDKKVLDGYEKNGGLLPGHSTRHCVPGVEISAGSLGHGLSMAAGIAYAGKLNKEKFRVFAILSDGECDEGSTWEAVLFSGHHKLDNLITIIDYNKLQGFGYTKDILELDPFSAKWESFGWETREIDGHDFEEIIKTFSKLPFVSSRPSMIIAHTIKGKGGVERHINKVSSQYNPPTKEELKKAIADLENEK